VSAPRALPLSVVLTCTSCDTAYEPSLEDFGTGNTACPDPECGGWCFSTALTGPTTGGAA